MLYRFPISIYIIFSRLWHRQTLAALVHLRSFLFFNFDFLHKFTTLGYFPPLLPPLSVNREADVCMLVV